MFDLKTFKEAIVLYGMLSPFVKQILKSQAPQKRIIPKDQKDLVTEVLGSASQLQWNMC